MEKDIYLALTKVHWQEPDNFVASWIKRGISHGFAGVAEKEISVNMAKQVHGTNLVEASCKNSGDINLIGDGVFTNAKGTKVGVQTADCLPILFWSPDFVLAVHAGWRGLVDGIIEISMDKMLTVNQVSKISVAMGPCIGPGNYEVGPEVVAQFERCLGQRVSWVLSPGQNDRWYLDLQTAAVISLLRRGLSSTQIAVVRNCTFDDHGFWSYRRQGAASGRNISWISCDLLS